MNQNELSELLTKIRNIHDSIERKVKLHENFFKNGDKLIKRLQREQRGGYDNSARDSVVIYIDDILTDLYHIEGNSRGPFRDHFREHVVLDDISRFKAQIDYLKNWTEFAVASGSINGHLNPTLKTALVTLKELYKYAKKGKRTNESILIKKANAAYEALYSLKDDNTGLRAYAMEHFHAPK